MIIKNNKTNEFYNRWFNYPFVNCKITYEVTCKNGDEFKKSIPLKGFYTHAGLR